MGCVQKKESKEYTHTRINFVRVELLHGTKHLIFLTVHHHLVQIAHKRRQRRVAIVRVNTRLHRHYREFPQLHRVRHTVVASRGPGTRGIVDISQRFKGRLALGSRKQCGPNGKPHGLTIKGEQKATGEFGEGMKRVELDRDRAVTRVGRHGVVTLGAQTWF